MLPFAKRSYLLSQVHIVKLFQIQMIRINFKLHMKNESNGQDLRMNFEIVNV